MRSNTRFPSKKSSKGKGKAAIDFSSPAKAIATSPSFSADDWQEEGERQEGQGERYIWGDKAQRHYQHASVSYTASHSLSPSFQAAYNASRVIFLLATDHLPSPQCFATLLQSIQGYRAALELPNLDTACRVDGLFNLAQALSAAHEMVQEGAADWNEAQPSVQLAWEAKTILKQVEELQMTEMKRAGFDGGSTDTDEEEDMVEDGEESKSVEGGEVIMGEAAETTVVTPYTIIGTLLESITNDLLLFSSTPESDTSTNTILAQSASETLLRATNLRTLITLPNDEQDLEFSLASLNLASTFPPFLPPSSPLLQTRQTIISSYSALIQNHRKNPELLSAFADYLVDSLESTQDPTISLSTLSEASTLYTRSYDLLSSRLSPPKSIPPHLIPSLLSSNLASRALIQLSIFHLQASASPSTSSEKTLEEAHKLAIEAVEISGAGIKVTVDPQPRELKLAKMVTSVPPNWAAVKACRDALFLLMRIRLRVESLRAVTGVVMIGAALGRDVGKDAERFVEECKSDWAWTISGEGVEEAWWNEIRVR